MFRELRRQQQLLNKEECEEILDKGSSGILSVLGDDDYPYGVPLNYVYHNGKFYFHCAKEGYKIDAIQKHNKVSFTVVGEEENLPEKFTAKYKSVIVFGKASMVNDDNEKKEAILAIADKYSPNESVERKEEERKMSWEALNILRLDIDHISGKQAKEYLG